MMRRTARHEIECDRADLGAVEHHRDVLGRRMRAAQEGTVNDTEWWPAPELTDWLYAPISVVDAGYARAFDKKVRFNRALGV